MKKSVKTQKTKKTTAKHELPELVTVMSKFVERIEGLEKKTDLVLSRIGSLPSEIRRICQDFQSSGAPHHAPSFQSPGSHPNHGPVPDHSSERRERIMYKAICSDCRKGCEVPFKPTGERPVYCKECFTIRKAGHVPQDPDKRGEPVQGQRKLGPTIQTPVLPAAEGRLAKSKNVKKAAKKAAKKKKR